MSISYILTIVYIFLIIHIFKCASKGINAYKEKEVLTFIGIADGILNLIFVIVSIIKGSFEKTMITTIILAIIMITFCCLLNKIQKAIINNYYKRQQK